MISFSSLSKRRGATLAGVFSLALGSVLLLCGAGSVPVENLLPQGVMQGDLNAGGHNLTNAATVSATNVIVSGSLTTPTSFTLPFSRLTGTPTTMGGYGITNGVANTIQVNGHALSGNVTVTPGDLNLVIGTNTQGWSANLDAASAAAGTVGWVYQITGTGVAGFAAPSGGGALPYTPGSDGVTLINNFAGNPILTDDANGNPFLQFYASGTAMGSIGATLGGQPYIKNSLGITTFSEDSGGNFLIQGFNTSSHVSQDTLGFTPGGIFAYNGGGVGAPNGLVALDVSGELLYPGGGGELTLAGSLLDQVGGLISDVSGNRYLGATASPSSSATGVARQIAWDTKYFYICSATNTWIKVHLSPTGFPKMTSNTSGTFTFNSTSLDETVYNTSASTIASGTITLPTSSAPGQIIRFATHGTITAVTMAGGTVSIGTAPTTITADSSIAWQCVTSGTWARLY